MQLADNPIKEKLAVDSSTAAAARGTADSSLIIDENVSSHADVVTKELHKGYGHATSAADDPDLPEILGLMDPHSWPSWKAGRMIKPTGL